MPAKLTYDYIIQFGIKNNIKLLSKEYINQYTSLYWECLVCAHKFDETIVGLKDRVFACIKCKDKQNSEKWLEIARKTAEARDGKCLSTIGFKNQHTKLIWECRFGHQWEARLWNVKTRKHWCPYCSSGIYEAICRVTFEKSFDKPFPRTRPDWLRNKEGNKLELDGYCAELNIAFEHNGMQHYKLLTKYPNDLKKIKRHDAIKRKMCKQRNIKLYQIKELNSRDKIEQLIKLLGNKIDINTVYMLAKNNRTNMLDKVKTFAKSRNEECLSEYYINNNEQLLFKCAIGHEFKRGANHYLHGVECFICYQNRMPNINTILDFCKINNIICLDDKYINSKTQINFKCQNGHIFNRNLDSIRRTGLFCGKCSGSHKPAKLALINTAASY